MMDAVRVRFRSWWIAAALLGLLVATAVAAQRQWLPIDKDGLRDPTSPAVKLLQAPAEALSALAPDTSGNQVNWVEALDRGQIEPRSQLYPDTEVEVYDSDVYLNLQGGLPVVRFPHRQHTLWLACSNCHDRLFKREAGATRISMFAILEGEQCGVCHGAVAFPLTECSRCHNTSREDALAAIARQQAERMARETATENTE